MCVNWFIANFFPSDHAYYPEKQYHKHMSYSLWNFKQGKYTKITLPHAFEPNINNIHLSILDPIFCVTEGHPCNNSLCK